MATCEPSTRSRANCYGDSTPSHSPGEFGGDTWEGDSAKGRGGVNMWSIPTVDTQRGIAFLPLTSPSADYYGGDRKGAGLFGDSLVAVDALTGKRIWHFQTVHHNIWDYDLPAQPTLVTVRRDGKMVDAVAQVTKTGFTFLFERTTGKPLFDIVEKPVPASEVPGEALGQRSHFRLSRPRLYVRASRPKNSPMSRRNPAPIAAS